MLTVTDYITSTNTSNPEVIVYIKSTLTLRYPCNCLRIGYMPPLTVNIMLLPRMFLSRKHLKYLQLYTAANFLYFFEI